MIRTLTVSTITLERKKEELYSTVFRRLHVVFHCRIHTPLLKSLDAIYQSYDHQSFAGHFHEIINEYIHPQ